MWSQRRKEVFTLVVVFTGVVLVSALAVYYLGGVSRTNPQERSTPEAARTGSTGQQGPDAVLGVPDGRTAAAPSATEGNTFFDRLFGSQHSSGYATGAT